LVYATRDLAHALALVSLHGAWQGVAKHPDRITGRLWCF
jgi:hypothetical protein